MQSQLDNVFGSKRVARNGNTILYMKTMLEVEPKELTTRDAPSDHLPVVMNLTVT